MRSLFVAGLALAVVGCTSFYPEDPWFDAAALEIDSLSVSEVFEAQQDLLIVATGSNIAPGAVMRIVVDGEVVAASERTTVDSAGQMIAAVFDLPVLEDLPEGDEIEISVEVVQLADGTAIGSSSPLRVAGLDELVGSDVVLDELTPPRPLYSRVQVTTLVATFDTPLLLRATTSIDLGSFDFRGRGGGCAFGGGDPLCAAANGVNGVSQNGLMAGGGGEHSTYDLVPFHSHRSGAGGAGGPGAMGAAGGVGGPGGRAFGLDAPEVIFRADRPILTNGGPGGAATCAPGNESGPGGGGAGGAVWVRATRNFVTARGKGAVINPGGFGGLPCDSPIATEPGMGGIVRLDTTDTGDEVTSAIEDVFLIDCSDLQGVSRLTCAFKREIQRTQITHGPAFAAGSRIFSEKAIPLMVTPSDGSETFLRVDGDLLGVIPPDNSIVSLELEVSPGAHEVCAYLGEDVDRTLPEAGHCIEIAYLP